jgi:two-component system nitrogen regulation response regulator GlnG
MERYSGSTSRWKDPEGPAAILLVDEDRDFRDALADNLREDGCVVYAYDRVSGLPPVSELPPIDLLVTDTIEPRDGGIAFAEAWHRARPHVPVLVVTTDPALAWDTWADCRGGVEIRRKPIDYGRIRSTLHALCPRLPAD